MINGHTFRRYIGPSVIGLVLVAGIYCSMKYIVAPYQREKQIAADLQSHGGYAYLKFCGPKWIPQFVLRRVPVWDRIDRVGISRQSVPASLIADLGTLSEVTLIHVDLEGTASGDAELHAYAHLTKLTRLELRGTKITDTGLQHVRGLTNLTYLGLRETVVTDVGMAHLSGLMKLEILDLRDTAVGNDGLRPLQGLPLRSLLLNYCAVTDAGLETLPELPRLQRIELKHTGVTDAGLKHLQQMTGLRFIGLEYTTTTSKGREQLRSALPSCVIEPVP